MVPGSQYDPKRNQSLDKASDVVLLIVVEDGLHAQRAWSQKVGSVVVNEYAGLGLEVQVLRGSPKDFHALFARTDL